METNLEIQAKYNNCFDKLAAKGINCPKVIFYETVDSTNDRLKILAEDDAEEGTFIVSYCQTNGHGRSGRSFYSPKGGNVYMSILLRPDNLRCLELITPAAAVAVCRAIRRLTDIDTNIKWVNDIFLKDKKICGILASAYGFEEKRPYVVLGIGINVFVDAGKVPEEIRDIYGALFDKNAVNFAAEDFLPKLAAAVYEEYMKIYINIFDRSFMDEYKDRSNIIGKDVCYLSGNESIPVRVTDIDENGRIVLLHKDGTVKSYNDGEIRIKLI